MNTEPQVRKNSDLSGGELMDQKSTEQLYNNLSPDQKKQVENILADKNKTQQILNSPQAKELLKKLMGEK